MVYFVIVRGPLGVGKSTVSERLALVLGAECVSIDGLLEEHELWVEGSLSEFLRANEYAARRAKPHLARGRPVIFDGNFYWEAQIEDLVARLDYRHHVFTLQAPLEVCIARDAQRSKPYGEEATKEVYAKSTRFDWGTGVDATRPLDVVVEGIVSHLS